MKKLFLLLIISSLFASCSTLPVRGVPGEILSKSESKFFEDKSQDLKGVPQLTDDALFHYVKKLLDQISNHHGVRVSSLRLMDVPFAQGMTEDFTIYISKGMLYAIRNEAQLVALLSHEVGHIKLKHYEQEPSAAQEAVSSVISSVVGSEELARQADSLIAHQFSQSQEQDADNFGARTAYELGYDAYEFPKLFDVLWKRSNGGLIDSFKSIKQSHKSLKARAENLRTFLEKSKIPSRGKIAQSEYLKKVGVNFKPSDPTKASARKQLIGLVKEVLAKKNKKVSIAEFINYMNKARLLAKDLEVLSDLKVEANSTKSAFFMKENVIFDSPWGQNSADLKTFQSFLSGMTHLGLGILPVLGDAIDFYEVVTGEDYLTGDKLTANERIISSLGLLIGSGQNWRSVSRGIQNAAESGAEGISRADEAAVAMRRAEQFASEAPLYGRSKIGTTYRGHFEDGPITDRTVVDSFFGAKYTAIEPQAGEKFYRVGDARGRYWSRTEPTSQIRTMSENAVLPEWNKFSEKSELIVPRGLKGEMYEGISGNMSGKISKAGTKVPAGGIFHGGGNQVFIPESTLKKLKPFITTRPL